jgi:hypothetical protein
VSWYVFSPDGEDLRCETNDTDVAATVAAMAPGSTVRIDFDTVLWTQPSGQISLEEACQQIEAAYLNALAYRAASVEADRAAKKAAYDRLADQRDENRKRLGYTD